MELKLITTSLLLHVLPRTVLASTGNDTCSYIDYLGNDFDIDSIPCERYAVCQKTFTVSYIELPPYFSRVMVGRQKLIERKLGRCCGRCAAFKDGIVFNSIAEVTLSAIKSSDFIYPFFATSTTKVLYGYHYLPIIDIPKLMYVTKMKKADIGKIVVKVLPITLICILIAAVSGFVCWLIETWGNRKEFSRPFLIGWLEGFWWAFVSMTTVGYGDKVPRSLLGRVFSVVWVSIGIIAYGLLTGVVYSEVDKVNSPPSPKIKDSEVGVLLYRDYDAFMVAEKGGKVYRNENLIDVTKHNCTVLNVTQRKCDAIKGNIFITDAMKLLDRLEKDEIDGLVFDQYTLWALTNLLSSMRESGGAHEKEIEDPGAVLNILQHTVTTPVEYRGTKQYTYGALVRRHEDYMFFGDFIKDSRLRDHAIMAINWNYDKKSITRKHKKDALFSHRSDPFLTALASTIIIIGVIIAIGIVSDLFRTKGDVQKVFCPGKTQECHDQSSMRTDGAPLTLLERVPTGSTIS